MSSTFTSCNSKVINTLNASIIIIKFYNNILMCHSLAASFVLLLK